VAERAGADAIGMIFVPGSKRELDIARAVGIADAVGPFLTKVGVFRDAPVEEVRRAVARVRLDVVQLHGVEGGAYVASLRDEGAANVLQPDATVCGGITEWLKIAHHAAAYDVAIAPHYNWNLHASLVGAIENGLWVEYFYRDMDVKVFDDVVSDPLRPDDEGRIALPDEPGHGVRLDEDALEEFR
jgi:hypothetical protein